MKFIAYILAVLVLALSIMPCADTKAVHGKVKAEVLGATSQQHGNPSDDACSPFCTCSCCAGFSINHFVASINYLIPYQSKAVPAHLPAEVIEITLPIWQPPQIV